MTRDELRTAITKALVEGWVMDDRDHTFEASTDAVLALLPVAEHRHALLDAMNLDVREMDFWDEVDRGGEGTIKGWFVSPRSDAS